VEKCFVNDISFGPGPGGLKEKLGHKKVARFEPCKAALSHSAASSIQCTAEILQSPNHGFWVRSFLMKNLENYNLSCEKNEPVSR
jgi:hypothetical protein